MKVLYFDCSAGISGDMTLAALLDLGIDKDILVGELKKLGLDGWEIVVSGVSKQGIGAKHVDVVLEKNLWEKMTGLIPHPHHHHSHSHVHRNMSDIERIIDAAGISNGAKDLAKRIFMRLAVAEAKVHGSTPEEVHFHEVGAMDSIIDIVGTAICIDILAPDRVYASVLHDGYGFVKCQHGTIPVPVPAVTEVLANRGATLKQLDIEGEMMTPTGAAIVAELAESFGPMPEMKLTKTGYGAGQKDFPIPNVLRIMLGETMTTTETSDTVTVIETNIDDTTPEILGYVMDRLLEAGAKDTFFTHIQMKKNRPATLVSVICDDDKTATMERILFTETSTIGLRKYSAARSCLPRKAVTATTLYGNVKAKETTINGTTRTTIEYDDACRLASEKNVPLRDILFQR
jgi:uncharacterized protein (TIGR00299 family) protein